MNEVQVSHLLPLFFGGLSSPQVCGTLKGCSEAEHRRKKIDEHAWTHADTPSLISVSLCPGRSLEFCFSMAVKKVVTKNRSQGLVQDGNIKRS